MCGITGWYGEAHAALLREMTDSITHRGPDEQGMWSGPRVSLGATRLSIIDLQAGSQPIWNEDRTLAIIMNGEIYNAAQLRLQLQDAHTLRTGTVTEVVLHLFEERGVDCFQELDGIFAIAVTDGTRLWLARDGVGVKPLFYARTTRGDVVFASEIKSLLRHPGIPRRLNLQAVAESRVFNWTYSTGSYLEGIEAVRPGTCLEIAGDFAGKPQIRQHPFYALPAVDPNAVPDLSEIKEELRRSVLSQMVSDAPLGVMLSGGVDSSLMTLIMREASPNRQLPVFTMADRLDLPDLVNARELARIWNLDHHVVLVTPEEMFRNLASAVWSSEWPNVSPMWFLAQQIPKHLKVLMCGEGADELFGGYPVYTKIQAQKAEYEAQLSALRQVAPELADAVDPALQQLFSSPDNGETSFYEGYMRSQLQYNHLNDIDRGSMAHGIEVRVPFLAKGLIDRVMPLGLKHHLNRPATKKILRDVYTRVLRDAGLNPEHYRSIWASKSKASLPHGSLGTYLQLKERLELSLSPDVLEQHPYAALCRFPMQAVLLDLFRVCFIEYGGRFPTPQEWAEAIDDSYPVLTPLRSVLTQEQPGVEVH